IGLTTTKNPTATAPPPSKRIITAAAMIHGSFDFCLGGAAGACAGVTTFGETLSSVAAGSIDGDVVCGAGAGGGCGAGVTGVGTSTMVFDGDEKSAVLGEP